MVLGCGLLLLILNDRQVASSTFGSYFLFDIENDGLPVMLIFNILKKGNVTETYLLEFGSVLVPVLVAGSK